MNIAFVGAGNMAGALIGGLIAHGQPAQSIGAVDPSDAQRQALAGRWQVRCVSDFDEVGDPDIVVLAVKPQIMPAVARGLAGKVDSRLVISVAAGIRAGDLSRWLGGHRRIVRAMPNTPALIGRGVTALAAAPGLSDEDRRAADRIMSAVGETVWVDDESQLDAVTAVSGSGPAYVFYFIELLERAAISVGLPAGQARALALATFRGAAELAASTDDPPSVLRDRVTSRGGTTAAALAVLSEGPVAESVERAVAAAARRSAELGDEFGRD